MTKAELYKILAWRLGDRDDMTERMDSELDYVQEYVLEGNVWAPWFLVTEQAAAPLTAGERRLPYPEDFLSELEESALWLELAGGGTLELVKGEYDVLARKYPITGQPLRYSTQGEYFHFFPTPNLEYTVFMRYYGRDEKITLDTGKSKWLKYCSDVVIAELGFILAGKHIKDANLAAAFQQEAQVAWKRLYDRHISLQEINQVRTMGGEV